MCTVLFLAAGRCRISVADGFASLGAAARCCRRRRGHVLPQVGRLRHEVAVMIFIDADPMDARRVLATIRRCAWLARPLPAVGRDIAPTRAPCSLGDWGATVKLGPNGCSTCVQVLSGLGLTAALSATWKQIAQSLGKKDAPRGHDPVPRSGRPQSPRLRTLAPAACGARTARRAAWRHDVRDRVPGALHHIVADEHRIPRSRRCCSGSTSTSASACSAVTASRRARGRHPHGHWHLEFSAYDRRSMIYTKEMLLALEPAGRRSAVIAHPDLRPASSDGRRSRSSSSPARGGSALG